MDKELIEIIVNLKMESKILRGLVDVILYNTCLGYTEDNLRLTNEDKVLTVIKTFYGEEYENRLKKLMDDRRAEIERLKSKGIQEVE